MKRALDNPDYEPPVRDPKAIRNTVLILVVMMILGGFLVVWKYLDDWGEKSKDVIKGRPPMMLGNLRKNFQVEGPDKKIYLDGFTFLEGKISLMTTVSLEMPEQSIILLDQLKKTAEHYKENPKVQFVIISADKFTESSANDLRDFCVANGCTGEQWLFIASKSDEFSNYINKNLKLGDISRVDKDTGKRIFPDVTRLVDPYMKLRGSSDHFHFVKIYKVEKEQGKKEFVSEWHKYLNKNIDYLSEHEEYDKEFSKKNNSNRYNVPLIVFGGFILFILFMGYRVKTKKG